MAWARTTERAVPNNVSSQIFGYVDQVVRADEDNESEPAVTITPVWVGSWHSSPRLQRVAERYFALTGSVDYTDTELESLAAHFATRQPTTSARRRAIEERILADAARFETR